MNNNHIYTFEKLIFNFLMGYIEKSWFSIEFNSVKQLEKYSKRLIEEYNFKSSPYDLNLSELPVTKMVIGISERVGMGKSDKPCFFVPIRQREIECDYIQIGGDNSDLFILN